uniref:Uncharacterized protein n=1 Tax=Tanacetum cinerariifolium TaxID=118510 RepID=A0A699GWH5_TANCI|nr:hypothetical protein [Tanacetum cinerariifolium]
MFNGEVEKVMQKRSNIDNALHGSQEHYRRWDGLKEVTEEKVCFSKKKVKNVVLIKKKMRLDEEEEEDEYDEEDEENEEDGYYLAKR